MMIRNKYLFAIFASVLFLVGCSTSKKGFDGMTSAEIKIAEKIIDAATQMEIGNFEQAEKLYQEILSVQADNSLAYYQLASLNFQQRNIDRAIEYNLKAISFDKKNHWYREQLAEIYMQTNRLPEAIEQYEILIKQNPKIEAYYQQIALMYYQNDELDKVIGTINRMEKQFGFNENMGKARYGIYNAMNQKDKAEKEMKNLSEEYPQNVEYLSVLAQIAVEKGKKDEALRYFTTIETIAPNDENNTIALIEYYHKENKIDSLETYISRLCLNKDVNFSTKNMVMLSIYGDKVDTDMQYFLYYFYHLEQMRDLHAEEETLWQNLGIAYIRTQNMEGALVAFKKSIELGIDDYPTFESLLFVQNSLEPADSILATANKVIELYPEKAVPYLFKGISLMEKSDYIGAILSFEQGVKRENNNQALKEDFYFNIATSYYGIGDKENAYKNYECVLKINPNNVYALNNYAYYLCLEEKDLNKAETMARKAYEMEPNNITFADTYACVLLSKGESKQALKILEKFLDSYDEWSDTVKEHYEDIKDEAEE